MRYLCISCIFLLVSCKVTTVENFKRLDVPITEIHNRYFSDQTMDYVYTIAINVYGREMSGVLVIKKIDTTTHRIICTSQFGSTFFDIEFKEEGHVVHSIVKELDRNIILDTLVSDFSLLVKEKNKTKDVFVNSERKVLMSANDKRMNYYFYKSPDATLQKIVHASKRNEKFTIYFDAITKEGIAKKIGIHHHTIKLSIVLNLLKQ